MQGCLRGERVAASLETGCAHCERKIHIDIEGADRVVVHEKDAEPLLFEPRVDWERFQKPNIIDDF